jgi:hypothetical protein
VRWVSAGAERREGVLCVAPAYVVSPQAKKKEKKVRSGQTLANGGGLYTGATSVKKLRPRPAFMRIFAYFFWGKKTKKKVF